jgi:hypothetical protein
MSHWFSGWKFWPDRPQGPVDDAYRQVKWIRPYRPGPIRIAISLAGVLFTTAPSFLTIGALLSPGPVVDRLIVATAFGLITAGLMIAITRFFAVGVYVNDAGVRIMTLRTVVVYPWRLVADVSTTGNPADGQGGRVIITVRDVGPLATPVHRSSPDFLGRPEAFAMASLAIERWWRDAGTLSEDT